MSALASGLIGAVIAYGVITLAEHTQKSATRSLDGWRTLRAGWLINGIVIGSTALAALTSYFLLSGGSSLPNAVTQNGFAALILAASAACALFNAWSTYGHTIMWKGDKIQVRAISGGKNLRRISDVTNVRKFEMLGKYCIDFSDGSKISFSAYLHGANELLAKLPREALRD